jgi:flagellar biogenesis protein FliO
VFKFVTWQPSKKVRLFTVEFNIWHVINLILFIFFLVQQRLKSVQNIEKITKSMKMIASTKVNKAQRGMEAARIFGQASNCKYKR